MTCMLPPYLDPGVPSSERRAFSAIKSASGSDDWTALHSLGISSDVSGDFGEIDLVLVIPGRGILCIEVKGGEVSQRNGIWYTRRHDERRPRQLKRSPFLQAQQGMWKLKRALEKKFGPGALECRCPIGWMAILPDVACPPVTTEFTRAEAIDASDLDMDIGPMLMGAPSLGRLLDRQNLVPPDHRTCRRIIDFLRPDFERVELANTDIWNCESQLKALTQEQYSVIDSIAENRICLVKGSAGTGKTVLALEFARRLSRSGHRVLLACYNRNLGDWLRGNVEEHRLQGVVAGHIHGLLRERIEQSTMRGEMPLPGEVDSAELYGRTYYEMGARAIAELNETFDAVIVDEIQDLDVDMIALLADAWRSPGRDMRIVLFGDFIRQALYGIGRGGQKRLAELFPGLPVFGLHLNCRNTRAIALQTDLVCGHTGSRTSDRQPAGDPVQMFYADGQEALNRLQQIVEVLQQAGFKPNDVVILGSRRRENSLLADVHRICGWKVGQYGSVGADELAYTTAHSFKGLESRVIIVVEAGSAITAETDAILYVSMSRARVRLYVICRPEARAAIDRRAAQAAIEAMRKET